MSERLKLKHAELCAELRRIYAQLDDVERALLDGEGEDTHEAFMRRMEEMDASEVGDGQE